jgi:hypothetical protein
MDWNGFGRKRLWPILRYYPSICLEGFRKTKKNLSPDSQSPDRELNPGPPEYGVLTTQHNVWYFLSGFLTSFVCVSHLPKCACHMPTHFILFTWITLIQFVHK